MDSSGLQYICATFDRFSAGELFSTFTLDFHFTKRLSLQLAVRWQPWCGS
jgi:hypothetical protein